MERPRESTHTRASVSLLKMPATLALCLNQTQCGSSQLHQCDNHFVGGTVWGLLCNRHTGAHWIKPVWRVLVLEYKIVPCVTMKKLTSLWLCFLTYKMGIMNCASELRLSWEPGRRSGPPAWPHSGLSLSSQRELSVFYFCRSQRAELGVGHVTVCGLIPSPLSGVTIYSSMAESTLPLLQQSHPHLRWPESFSARVQGLSRLWFPSEGWWRCWTHGDAFDFLGTLLALSNAKEELHLRSCLAFFLTH